MEKYSLTLWAMLAVTAATAPAFAQEQAREKTAQPVISKPAGAASASYARCAPGSPIGGIVVKGGVNPTKRTGETEDCPSAASAPDEHRTYTGGRRNEDAPPAASGDMPSRLSMTPTTIKAVAPAATGSLKKKDE